MLYDVRIEDSIYLLTVIIFYVTQRFIEVNGDDAIHNILPPEGSKSPWKNFIHESYWNKHFYKTLFDITDHLNTKMIKSLTIK